MTSSNSRRFSLFRHSSIYKSIAVSLFFIAYLSGCSLTDQDRFFRIDAVSYNDHPSYLDGKSPSTIEVDVSWKDDGAYGSIADTPNKIDEAFFDISVNGKTPLKTTLLGYSGTLASLDGPFYFYLVIDPLIRNDDVVLVKAIPGKKPKITGGASCKIAGVQ